MGYVHGKEEDTFPFYEDYLKDSDFRGFLKVAKDFLENNPSAPEAPRLAYDFMMVGKAASDVDSVKYATNLLLFNYTQSLPSLNFISSFDRGSPRLIELLKAKAEQGDLSQKDFAVAYCRAILFIARAQGPELLKDKSLRLRTHLLAKKAGVNEILSSSTESLVKESMEDSNFGKVTKIALGEYSPLEKVKNLGSFNDRDAEFCKSFFMAQLDEKEAKSEEMLLLQINDAIFSNSPSPQDALRLISSLSPEKRKDPKIIFLKSISLHFDDQTEEAIILLNSITEETKMKKEWISLARSYSQGLEFLDNRKKVLAEALGKAFANLDNENDSLFVRIEFSSDKSGEYQLLLGTSQKEKYFEIQVRKDNQLQVAYRTQGNQSSILAPDAKGIITFKSKGALPVPKFGIQREVETGAFGFNFNLNFSSSFDEYVSESSKIMENSYLSTSKGRNALLDYIFRSKAIWLEPAKTVNGGTLYPISFYSNKNDNFSTSSLSFDLAGNLQAMEIGFISIKEIKLGDSKILESMPDWPSLPEDIKEKFDFPSLMKILGETTKIFQ